MREISAKYLWRSKAHATLQTCSSDPILYSNSHDPFVKISNVIFRLETRDTLQIDVAHDHRIALLDGSPSWWHSAS